MGCNGSKSVDTELVIRCRERRDLMKAAAEHRYDLAAAHVSYFHSLQDVGDALRRFVDEEIVAASSSSPSSLSSPSLALHSDAGEKPKKSSVGVEESSHLHISSDDSSDDDDDNFHLHNDDDDHVSPASPFLHSDLPPPLPASPFLHQDYPPPPHMGYLDPFSGFNNGGYTNTYAYYMKRSTPVAKTVIHETEAASTTGYSNAYYSPDDFFGYQSVRSKKPSPQAPPPPSPKASVWDFLNPFDAIDQEYPSYSGGYGYGSFSSSPDSNEVREREGIPDLEEETETETFRDETKSNNLNNASKKKMVGERSSGTGREKLQKRMANRKTTVSPQYNEGTLDSKPMSTKPSEVSSIGSTVPLSSGNDDCSLSDMTGSINVSEEKASSGSIVLKSPEDSSVKSKGVNFEADQDIESSKLSNMNNKPAQGTRDLREVVAKIRDEFEIASSYGKEVAMMLEVEKLPYSPNFIRALMSRILHMIVPPSSSLHPSTHSSSVSKTKMRKLIKPYLGDAGPEINVKPCYLSSTLAQLYEWEKRLYKEVKEEEQLRLVYERQCRKLKALDERGTESTKIDAVQVSIRKLLTKLNVSIKAIDSISSRIHKLRDEELQPQVAELINGLLRMWRSMLSCHQKQFQAITDSKTLALKANIGLRDESAVRASLELELQLLAWCGHFNDWICTQKFYVESLNGWLRRCLLYEPEETPDGPVPFSPSRLGAPPIFVICNDWNQAMEVISETRVAMAMNNFASSLRKLWERQDEERRQRIKAEYLTKDYKRRSKLLRMEKGKMEYNQDVVSQKSGASIVRSDRGVSAVDDLKVDLDTFKKKLVEEKAKHKDSLKLVHDAASSSLQGGLLPIFKALENFTLEAVKAHEQVRLKTALQ